MNKKVKYLSVVMILLMSTSLLAMKKSMMNVDSNPKCHGIRQQQDVAPDEKARYQQEEGMSTSLKKIKKELEVVPQKILALEEKMQVKKNMEVEKPFSDIPEVAKGYEDIYSRFLKGKLIYRPDPRSDEGKIELLIRNLKNPLEGTFDISQYGDSGEYLSIATGYRKEKNKENASKLEIWITPRFLIEKNLEGNAGHFKPIMPDWSKDAPIGLFWNWGGLNSLKPSDYVLVPSEVFNDENLLEKKWELEYLFPFSNKHYLDGVRALSRWTYELKE